MISIPIIDIRFVACLNIRSSYYMSIESGIFSPFRNTGVTSDLFHTLGVF